MKNLKLFESTSGFTNFFYGDYVPLPNVSYTEDTQKVLYHPKPTRIAKFNITDDNKICFNSIANIKSVKDENGKEYVTYQPYGQHSVTLTKNDFSYLWVNHMNLTASELKPNTAIILEENSIESFDTISCTEPILDTYYLNVYRYLCWYTCSWYGSSMLVSELISNGMVSRLSNSTLRLNKSFQDMLNEVISSSSLDVLGVAFGISSVPHYLDHDNFLDVIGHYDSILPTTLTFTGLFYNQSLTETHVVTPQDINIEWNEDGSLSTYQFKIPGLYINASTKPYVLLKTPNRKLLSTDYIFLSLNNTQFGNVPLVDVLGFDEMIYGDWVMMYGLVDEMGSGEINIIIYDTITNELIPTTIEVFNSAVNHQIKLDDNGLHELSFETYSPAKLDSNIFNNISLTELNTNALKYVEYLDEGWWYKSSLEHLSVNEFCRLIDTKNERSQANLNSITVSPKNLVYDSRENCNAIIHTSTNELKIASNSTKIPSSITSIASYAYANVLMDKIQIPSNVSKLSSYAFANTLVSEIEFSDDCLITTIPGRCCDKSKNLIKINIPNNVTSIGYGAFYDCTNLTSIEVPNNVTSIDNRVFYGCTNLASITCKATVAPTLGWDYVFGSISSTGTLHYPKGSDYSTWIEALPEGWTTQEMEF